MKFAMIGDVHVNGDNLDIATRALQQANELSLENECDYVIYSGDIFDTKNIISNRTISIGTIINRVRNSIDMSRSIIIPGNHDLAGAGNIDACEVLYGAKLIRGIESRIWSIPNGEGYRVGILFIPWITSANLKANLRTQNPDYDFSEFYFNDCIEAIIKDEWNKMSMCKYRAIVGHFSMDGAKTNTENLMIGGSFTLSRSFLKDLNAEVIGAGHIHLAQDLEIANQFGGYIGSLIQTEFGEGLIEDGKRTRPHQPMRILVWDTETNTVTFPELTNIPRYWHMNSASWDINKNLIPPEDMGLRMVWVEDDTKPSDLPETVRYSRPIVKVDDEEDVKTTFAFSSDESPLELLRKYLSTKESDVSMESAETALDKILSDTQLERPHIGSIKQLNKIWLKNFGCHENTNFDLSNLRGLIGIAGNTGNGKTSFIEAPYASWFGEYITRSGTLVDRVTWGYIGDAELGVEWQGDKTYSAVRSIKKKTPKTGKAEAYVYEIAEGKLIPIAGPKLDDVSNKCKSLIGDQDLILATIFSAQKNIGNFVDSKPPDRKAHFNKITGAERFLILSNKAAEYSKADLTTISEMEAQILRMQQEASVIPEHKNKATEIESEIRSITGQLNAATEKNVPYLAEKARIKSILDGIEKINHQIAEKKKRIIDINTYIESLNSLIERQKARLSKMDEYRQISDQRSEKEALLAGYIKDRETKENDLKDLELQVANLRTTYQSLQQENQKLIMDEKDKYEKDLNVLRVKLSQLQNEYLSKKAVIENKRSLDRSKENEQILTMRLALDQNEKKLHEFIESSKILDSGYFDTPKCPQCPYLVDVFEKKNLIPELEEQITQLKTKIENHNIHLRENDSKIEAELNELSLAHHVNCLRIEDSISKMEDEITALIENPENIPGYTEIKGKITQNISAGKAAAEMMNSGKAAIPSKNREQEIRNFLDTTVALAEKELHAIDEINQGIDRSKTQINEYLSMRKTHEDDIANLEIDLSQSDVISNQQAMDEVDKLITENQKIIDGINTELSRKNQALGSVHGEIKRLESIFQKAEEKTLELKIIEERVSVWLLLKEAFGPNGIPKKIMESCIPRLHEIISELMTELDNQWGITIKSDHETKKGTIEEKIDIVIINHLGMETVLEEYSGGEQHLFKAIIRIAISKLQSELWALALKVFFFDEAFDALDKNMSSKLLRIFTHLESNFNQVFILSHNDDLLAQISQQIRFSKFNNLSTGKMVTE